MSRSRSSDIGPESRPVAVPVDFGPHSVARSRGVVTLPGHLWWSGPPLTLDSEIDEDCIRLYEIVLREGVDVDINEYITYSRLLELWDRLFLPRYVRVAWGEPLKVVPPQTA